MEQEQLEGSQDRPMESVYSTKIRAGKRRTYFFDVRATRSNDYFLTITESRKRFDNNGYDRHKIFIYKEDFNKFIKAVNESMDFVKTELMPNFDFDAFNHDEENSNAQETMTNNESIAINETIAPIVELDKVIITPNIDISSDPIATQEFIQEDDKEDEMIMEITEKKPLEAKDTHASQGDNLSGEVVDKW